MNNKAILATKLTFTLRTLNFALYEQTSYEYLDCLSELPDMHTQNIGTFGPNVQIVDEFPGHFLIYTVFHIVDIGIFGPYAPISDG